MWKTWKYITIGLASFLPGASIAQAAVTGGRAGRAAKAVLWQARQYTHIRTIHFKASSHFTEATVKGRVAGRITYEYWGEGSKYRVVFKQKLSQADYSSVLADNGRHLFALNRITGTLTVMRSRPTGGLALLQNPILEPLGPLAPLPLAHSQWKLFVDLPRFSSRPNSIFDRCTAVRDCGKPGADGSFQGCITGASTMLAAHVTFTLQKRKSWPHPLVTGWVAAMGQNGANSRLMHLRYRAYTLASGKKIYLPVAFEVYGRSSRGYFKGLTIARTKITALVLDKAIPPGTFRISYKLASTVIVAKHGKYMEFPVKPKSQPQGWSK